MRSTEDSIRRSDPAFGLGIGEVACVNCGQCLVACPVGAITEKSAIDKVWEAIADPDKVVLVQTAPAVRAAIGEEFGMPIGTAATKQMVGAMLGLGFDKVFDTDTAADLTILEEGTELLHRLQNGGKLPLITSCSPGWISTASTTIRNFSTISPPASRRTRCSRRAEIVLRGEKQHRSGEDRDGIHHAVRSEEIRGGETGTQR